MADHEKEDPAMTTETTETTELAVAEHTEPSNHYPPARAPQAAPAPPVTLFGTDNPVEVIERATATAEALCDILERQQLYKQIHSRRHVFIEGWALLGSMLGVFATTEWTRKVTSGDDGDWSPPKTHKEERTLHSSYCNAGPKGHDQTAGCKTYTREVSIIDAPGRGGWEARAVTTTATGQIVGAAEGECRWDEPNWSDRDSHALRSMAQTRAQSKALAMPLRFIVELAGFAGTPAEEMTYSGEDEAPGEGETTPACPACGARTYDNRAENDQRVAEGKKGRPAFKCRNARCTAHNGEPWITWDPHFFDSPEVKAKKAMVDVVAKHTTGWALYFQPDDPANSEEDTSLIQAAIDAGDDASRAGVMWRFLRHLMEPEPTSYDYDRIVAAAKEILVAIEEDANNVLTPEEAWAAGEEQLANTDTDGYAETDYR